ncbi:MAG: hypothetical protein GY801_52710 [bacterium]|nr:hypothetical protein [bacterium]
MNGCLPPSNRSAHNDVSIADALTQLVEDFEYDEMLTWLPQADQDALS